MTNTVASTILEQLGGRRFIAMTGSTGFIGRDDGLSFRVKARTTNAANAVRVTLDPTDLYTVEFVSVRGTKVRIVSVHSGVYADRLQALFTEQTGLYTRL